MANDKQTALMRLLSNLPSDDQIEQDGKEGGLRDNELQMFWEGGIAVRNMIEKQIEKLLPTDREQIEEAHRAGQGTFMKDNGWKYKATKYYTDTYGEGN